MERKKKEAVRGKHIKEKPDSKLTPKAAMLRAGRYKAIEAARKQVQEEQKSAAPQQDQEPYSAMDKVESYTAGAVHEIIRYPRHETNPFHRETDYREAPEPKAHPSYAYTRHETSTPKTPTPQERMRREAIKEYRQVRSEQGKNAFQRETNYAETLAPKPPTPQERMRREATKEYRQAKSEQSKNAFHRETH